MPTYGYSCQSCEREFETLQRMSDPPVAACPDCGSPGKRLFYPAGILFKGSGFYKTDSRGRDAASSASADGAKSSSDATGAPPTPATDKATDKAAAKPARDSGAESAAPATAAGANRSSNKSPAAPSAP